MLGLNNRLVLVLILSEVTLVSAFTCRGKYHGVRKSHQVYGDGVHYLPDLSYKMLLLSAVSYDSVHPQQCLNKSLPSAEFQLQTVVTRKCDFLDNKCSGYVAVSHAVEAIVVAFRGTKGFDQLLLEVLETLLIPEEHFLGGKVQTYWKRSFEALWPSMEPKVKSLVSANPSYQLWVTGYSLGGAMASLASAWLAFYNIAPRKNIILYTFGMPRVGNYRYAQQHDQLVSNSWRVVNYDDIVPHLPPLILPKFHPGPYHHGVEVFYSEEAVSVNSTHKECHGKPCDEDKTCSRSLLPTNLPQSIKRHNNYFSVNLENFFQTAVKSSRRPRKKFWFIKDRNGYKNGAIVQHVPCTQAVQHATMEPLPSSTASSIQPRTSKIISFMITIIVSFNL